MNIVWHKFLESTNKEVQKRVSSLDNLSVVAASWQSAGKGQGDHSWHSAEGENLTFSLLVKYKDSGITLKANDILYITEYVTSGIRKYLATKGIESKVKWPNDIYVGDGKICGILIENCVRQGLVEYSVIGVGLNVNETDFPDDLPNPVSMSGITGRKYEIRQALEELASYIFQSLALLSSESGRAALDEEFSRNVFRRPA